SITQYGYEDLVFIKNLKESYIQIEHIDNAVFHLNLETSELFLEKTKTALDNLLYLSKSGFDLENDSKIISKFHLLKKFGLSNMAGFIFAKAAPFLESNLLSKNPKLLLFDLYKLGYFCKISSE
ncbi:MAG: glycosyltransferase family 2 protein, partial [Flavobacterium sp.]